MAPTVEILTAAGAETLDLEVFEERVRAGMVSPETPVCFPVVTGERWVLARELEVFLGLYDPSNIRFRQEFNLARFPLVTFALICVNVLIYDLMALAAPEITVDALIEWGAKSNPHIYELGEWWRLLTANFVHGGPTHIFFNLFVLFHAGGALEQAYRAADYLLLLLVSGLAATLSSLLMTETISSGASGVVFGALGGLVVFGYRYGAFIPAPYRRFFGWAAAPYVVFLLYWGVVVPETDNWGHLGGLLGGATCAALLPARVLLDGGWRFDRPRTAVVAALVGLLALAPFFHDEETTPLTETTLANVGFAVSLPPGWIPEPGVEGNVVFGNGFGASFGLSVRGHRAPPDLETIAWELVGEQSAPDLLLAAAQGPETAGTQSWRVHSRTTDRDGNPMEMEIRLLRRGYLEYRLWLRTCCDRNAEYRALGERVLESFRWVEPTFVSGARDRLEERPGSADAQLSFAAALHRVGRFEEAAEAYRGVLNIAPDSREADQALLGLAACALHGGVGRELGPGWAEEAWQIDKSNADAALILAAFHEADGDTAAARSVLEEARLRNPSHREVRERLEALRRAGAGEAAPGPTPVVEGPR